MLPYPCPLPSGRWWPRHHNQSLCKTHSLLANQFFKISALIYLSLNTTSHFGEISLYSFKSHCPEEDNSTTVLSKKPSLPFAFSKGVILSKIDLNNPIYRMCLVAKSLNRSDAKGDHVLLQTLLLFRCKLLHYHARLLYILVSITTRSSSASLQIKGSATGVCNCKMVY